MGGLWKLLGTSSFSIEAKWDAQKGHHVDPKIQVSSHQVLYKSHGAPFSQARSGLKTRWVMFWGPVGNIPIVLVLPRRLGVFIFPDQLSTRPSGVSVLRPGPIESVLTAPGFKRASLSRELFA